MQNETTLKLLGVTVDSKLFFKSHLNKVYKNASYKPHAHPLPARISYYISQ